MLTLRKLFTWSRIPPRGWFVFGHDLIVAAASFVISLYLRVGSDIYLFFPHATLVLATVVFTVIAGSMFLITNLYKGVWRYASVADLLAIARAISLTIALFLIVLFLWTRLGPMPRSVPIINWFVLVALLGAPRFLYRIAKDRRLELRLHTEGVRRIPVVLVGSGHEAEVFIRALKGASQRLYHVVGIIAEGTAAEEPDPAIPGRLIDLNGTRREVIGVMPASFDFPTPEVDAWIPFQLDPASELSRLNADRREAVHRLLRPAR